MFRRIPSRYLNGQGYCVAPLTPTCTYERDSIASDEAMHRRYSRRHGRFDQPDPWDGSYDLTDPQSFNRYSYVSNDPVNFVDPSGLDPVVLTDGVDPFGVGGFRYGYHGVHAGYLGGPNFITRWRSDANMFEEWHVTELEGVFANFRIFFSPFFFMPRDGEEPKDCYEFANEVERIYERGHPYIPAKEFVERLRSRFDNSGNEFGEAGFKKAFRGSSTPNQARHYVGGLWAGLVGEQAIGETLGRIAADARELGLGVSPLGLPTVVVKDRADINLNAVSTRHGGALVNKETKPWLLADLIRKEVCE